LRLYNIEWWNNRWIGKDLQGSGRGQFEVLCRHLPGWTEDTHGKPPAKIAGVPAKIRTKRFPNISLQRYLSTSLYGGTDVVLQAPKMVCVITPCKVKVSLCLTNWALRHEDVWGSGCRGPRFLDLGTSWRWVVSFISRPLYPLRNRPRDPLDRRLGGPLNRSGRRGEEKILAPTRNRTATPSAIQPVAHRYNHRAIAVLVKPCSSEKDRCFWGTHRFHLQGGRISLGRNQHKQITKQNTSDDSAMWWEICGLCYGTISGFA
jgi:hypothetical protein